MKLFWALFKRDCLICFRQSSDYLLALCFWLLMVVFFPLTSNALPSSLHNFAPGILWLGLLLMQLLHLGKFFKEDYEEGILAELYHSPQDFFIVILYKLINFWLIYYLPVLLLAPLLATMLQFSLSAIVTLELTLLLGTPVLCLMSSLVSSLTLAIKNSLLLMNVLFLPLTTPILIFACNAINHSMLALPYHAAIAWLGVLLLISLVCIPIAVSYILKAQFE